MWPSSTNSMNSTVIGGLRKQKINFKDEEDQMQSQQQQNRKKLVDMIQEDFPRTPSPVHTNLVGGDSVTSGLHLESVPVVRRASKKPFSISGSVDAVMAAAIEAENGITDVEINFEFEKLKLLEEVDEDEQAESANWSKSLRMPSVGKKTLERDLEPFAYAESFAPFVSAPTLNSAPARSVNAYHQPPVPPGYNPNYISPVNTSIPMFHDENYKMAVMEDFRMNRSKRYELFDLKGMMIDFSTDQHGSRFIQQKLETASDAEKDAVFSEIYPLALQLMTDVFGNYVIQKFFEHGSKEQCVALANVMHGHVLTLSLQMYGCRVVQKALEHVPSDEQLKLVQELEGHVLRCVKDQNGNHVIQKCIECVPLKTSAPFLTASFLSQACALAMHPYGCRVIQRIFEHGPAEHSRALLDELLKNTGTLIQDQYGNYVIQHVLEHGHPSERSRIIKFLQGRLLEYSRHKFASNVVEKCVSYGTDSERQELIEEVLTPIPAEDGNTSSSSDGGTVIPLHLMMRDQFANYVVQKMLEIVDGEQRDLLLNCIRPQLFQLRKYTYGKHILAKVERMLGLAPSTEVIGIPQSAGGNVNNSSSGNQVNSHAQSHREYHSAPNSPITKYYDHSPLNSHPNNNAYHHHGQNFVYNPHNPHSHQNQQHQRRNPKFSKNDLNEFPPLGGRRR